VLSYLAGFQRSLQVLEGLSPATTHAYSWKVREFHAWLVGNDVPAVPAEITRRHIELYLEHCFYRGNSNQTRHTKLTALGKFFRYLKYEGTVSEDFTAEIPKPRIHVNRIQKFTKIEVLSFFRAIDIGTEKGRRDVVIFILAAFCGLRIGEICKLRIGNVIDDGKNIDIDISEDIGKKHSIRSIYLWKVPGEYVRSYVIQRLSQGARIQDTLLVSYKHGRPSNKPLTACAIDGLIKKYADKASIRKPKICCHMFRATHASDLRYIRGYDSAAIAGRMGHSNIATTDRYLPERGRIHKIYQSLAVYWKEFNHIWDKGEAHDHNSSAGNTSGHDIQGGNAIDGQT
jgi:integrase/recombinase XerD